MLYYNLDNTLTSIVSFSIEDGWIVVNISDSDSHCNNAGIRCSASTRANDSVVIFIIRRLNVQYEAARFLSVQRCIYVDVSCETINSK